ncbi:hypothetical protein ACEPAG_7480 [Sanghuangporus baumii]
MHSGLTFFFLFPLAAREKILRFTEVSDNRRLMHHHQGSAAPIMFELCFVGPHTVHFGIAISQRSRQ